MRSMIAAFVFDLDGTLVETEELKALSYARAAVEPRPGLDEADVVVAFKDFVGRSRQEGPSRAGRTPAPRRGGEREVAQEMG
jgi:phosphoglycolate phosphatase-like HAD superfamily hydrolase